MGLVGTVAQSVALVCHGNAFLSGRWDGSFLADSNTCQFCESVDFQVYEEKRDALRMACATPDEWLARLKDMGVTGLRLICTPQDREGASDRIMAGMIGGGMIWIVEVCFDDGHSEYWRDRWTVGNKDAPDNRIWQVSYIRTNGEKTKDYPFPGVDELSSALEGALRDIHDFAAAQDGLGNFAACFADARAALAGQGDDGSGGYDLFPPGLLPPAAARLLRACEHAWVFGGMGSWNDITFEGEAQDRYHAVSQNLFEVLNMAIAAAATASLRAD